MLLCTASGYGMLELSSPGSLGARVPTERSKQINHDVSPADVAEEAFGQRVREARTRRRWSQSKLARELASQEGLSLHFTAIAKLERGDGERRLRLGEAVAICRLLDIDISEAVQPQSLRLRQVREALPKLTDAMADFVRAQARLAETVKEHESAFSTVAELIEAGGHEAHEAAVQEFRDFYLQAVAELAGSIRNTQPTEGV